MSYRAEILAGLIAQQLDSLTNSGKIKWRLEGQKYTATFGGLSFEIEDTGQYWLVIYGGDGKAIATIMDTMIVHNVNELLRTIKHSLTPQVPRDDRSACLEAVFDILKKEA